MVAEASKHFSDLLREVQEGQSYVVTSDGRPVARIVPVDVELASARKPGSAISSA